MLHRKINIILCDKYNRNALKKTKSSSTLLRMAAVGELCMIKRDGMYREESPKTQEVAAYS